MASALDSLLQRFPKLGSYSVPFFARALYEDNFENVKDEFATSQDYINFLLQQEDKTQDIDRFGKSKKSDSMKLRL